MKYWVTVRVDRLSSLCTVLGYLNAQGYGDVQVGTEEGPLPARVPGETDAEKWCRVASVLGEPERQVLKILQANTEGVGLKELGAYKMPWKGRASLHRIEDLCKLYGIPLRSVIKVGKGRHGAKVYFAGPLLTTPSDKSV